MTPPQAKNNAIEIIISSRVVSLSKKRGRKNTTPRVAKEVVITIPKKRSI